MDAVEKYLKKYTENECSSLESFPRDNRYHHCVIIPAFDETPEFTQRLTSPSSLLEKNQALAIIIINQPDDFDGQCRKNLELRDHLIGALPTLWKQQNLTLLGSKTWGILLVDRFTSTPIPKKKGVGLARKVATDIAAFLCHHDRITSHWIHSTDADAHLPRNYFNAIEQVPQGETQPIAAIYQYQHTQNNSDTSLATQTYENSLNYYVAGLKWAGSPYAFQTLGSILAFDHRAYCKVRGFPQRAGGEDFYLLNKLAKLGSFCYPDSCIQLEPRVSHRVPFGTGPAVEKILSSTASNQKHTDYDPQVFLRLKEFLTLIEEELKNHATPETILYELPEASQHALKELSIDTLWTHLRDKKPAQKLNHFHWWFDGFRTLKFIHLLQRSHYPAIALTESPEQLFNTPNDDEIS